MTPRELAAVLGRRPSPQGFDRAALAALMHRFPDPPPTGVEPNERGSENR